MATILVADDNSNIQKMVGLALKDHGIDVVAVGNGEAAVRRLPDVNPDLILADIFMPVRNGYEVCEFVKKDPKYSHIPVILLVGAFDPLDEREAQRVGADGVLKKPFIPPDPLINMVKSALARSPKRPVAVPLPAPVPVPQPVMASVAYEAGPEHQPFPTPAAVSFGDAERPLAFGSLLETQAAEVEPEAEAYVAPVSHPELSDSRNWGVTPEEEEVEEEETPENAWRARSVPDELLTDETQSTAISPYDTAALGEKLGTNEDHGSPTGVLVGSETTGATVADSSDKLARDFFAPEDGSLTAARDSSQSIEASSPEQEQKQASESAQPSDAERKNKDVPEAGEKPEGGEKKDYENVFTSDAFPGLFVEERPLSSGTQVAEDSLQESPSAFAELSTGFNEAISFSPSDVAAHPSETVSAETHSADIQSTDASSKETDGAQSESAETPVPFKIPSLWEEQVRQAARLIASGSSDEPASFPSKGTEGAFPDNAQPTEQNQQFFSSQSVTESSSSIREMDHVSTVNDESPDIARESAEFCEALPPNSFPVEYSSVESEISKSRVETKAGVSEELSVEEAVPSYPSITGLHTSDGASGQSEESSTPPPTTATPAPAQTVSEAGSDLDAVVAKVLARMNPEMFQSVTQQLLKPVIEAIVRSELEKKQ